MKLSEISDNSVQNWGKKLFLKYQDNNLSFEEVAQQSVQEIYDSFTDDAGNRAFALVRIFRLSKPDEMPPEEAQAPGADPYWLTLMGTVGDEAPWNSRLESQGHRLLPAGVFETPMLSAAFSQLGFEVEGIIEKSELLKSGSSYTQYFHVEHAAGSPFIVAQEEFVTPYNIKSVIGIGSIFTTRQFYMCLAFSKVHISEQMATAFTQISPYLSTIMARHDALGKLWKEPATA